MTPAKLPVPLEKHILADCLEWLNMQPKLYAWRNNTGAVVSEYRGKKRMIRYGMAGSADILGLAGPQGRFVAVEVKRPGNRPSAAQEGFLADIRHFGGIAFWCDSVEMCEREYQRQRDFPLTPAFERSTVSSEF